MGMSTIHRAKSLYWGVAGIVATLGLLPAGRVQAQTLSDAAKYNLFTLGDASNSNVDVLGKIAVGGNANFNNYTIASNLAIGSSINAVVGGNYTNTYGQVNGSMVVGGNVNATDPTINGNLSANGTVTLSAYGTVNGNLTYGTSLSNPNTGVSGTTSKGTTTLPINFTTAATNLTNQSTALEGTAATGTIISDGYGHLTAIGTGSLNVYNLDVSLLASAYSLNLTAAAGSTVVINVTGVGNKTVSLPNQGVFVNAIGTSLGDVLFNFGDATSGSVLNLQSFNASILAPNTKIQGVGGGQYNGSLIGNSFTGNGVELHNDNLFVGNVGSGAPVVPEPGIVVTATSMLGMTAFGLVRGRRRRGSATLA